MLIVVRNDVIADGTLERDANTTLKVSKARAIIMQILDTKTLRVCLDDRANLH